MKLSKRLKSIADLILESTDVIDVGADHGLLSIYLNKYKNCSCLATDISHKSLERARINSIKYDSSISLMVTDGLRGISLKDQVIVIAGMGTKTIKKILDIKLDNDLIIMSHTNINELKEFLASKSYNIVLEKEVFDKRYYTIIKASKFF